MSIAARLDDLGDIVSGIVAKLDDMGKPAWIAVLVLSFILFWPVGLALLAYLIWSGRMFRKHLGEWRGRMSGSHWRTSHCSSGNRAFDEYRQETMRRLEDEQAEFTEFMDRLRHARDKAEFDQFMADRGRQPPPQREAPAEPIG